MQTILFLIIYSENDPVYMFMKKIIETYMNEMCQKYSLLYFFIQFNEDINNTDELKVTQTDNILYVNPGKESIIPGILIKTHQTMQYVNQYFHYDILIRTNISSFWNIPKLFELNLPNTQLFSGIYMFNQFISGTGIILSKDVCIKLCETIHNNDYHTTEYDDVFLSNKIKTIANVQPLPENLMYYLIHNDNNLFPENLTDYLYFRVKSSNREHDKVAFVKLLQSVYDM